MFFLELSCFFCDPTDVGNLISGSSAFTKSSFCIWKFSVHILLKPNLKDFEHYLASMWNQQNCIVVWTFFGIALLWDERYYFTYFISFSLSAFFSYLLPFFPSSFLLFLSTYLIYFFPVAVFWLANHDSRFISVTTFSLTTRCSR